MPFGFVGGRVSRMLQESGREEESAVKKKALQGQPSPTLGNVSAGAGGKVSRALTGGLAAHRV